MNLFRQYKGQICLTFLLLFGILMMPFQDYTERSFMPEQMNYSEDYLGVIESTEEAVTVPNGLGSTTLESDCFYFRKGSYETSFSVHAGETGNSVDIYDPLYLNPDNTTGKVLAWAPVTTDGELIHLAFTVEDYSECVQFRIHSESALKFYGIYLLSEFGLYRDPWIYAGLVLLSSALLLLYRTRKKVRPEVLILLSFAALWSSLPVFFPWLFRGHDMFFHYGRLSSLSGDLAAGGMFPVRLHSQMIHGFGYMSPVFYAEFFLYPFALLGVLGMSPIGCYQLLIIAANFATAGVSYYSFSRLCRSRKLGLITSFLYTLSMYRLINLYTRAAVGEVLATIFLPLLILGMYQLFLGDSRRWLTAVLAFTGLLQSHMITTELAIGFSTLFALCCIGRLRDRKRLIHLLLAALSTVLLNLWFILPFLDHMRYPVTVLYDARNLAGYSLYAPQIFDTGVPNPTGDALGRGTIAGEMPYSIGFLLLIGIILFLFVCFQKNQKHLEFPIRLGKICLVLGLLSLYASSIFFPWERLQRIPFINQLAGSIQFATRFLPFATVFLCVVSAIGIYGFFSSRELRRMLFLLYGIWAVYSSGSYLSAFMNQAESFVSWNDQMDHSQDSDFIYLISDNGAYFSVRKILGQSTAFLPSEGITLEDCTRVGSNASFTYTRSGEHTEGYVDVSLNYYPCLHAYDEQGNRLETELGELLRLRVLLPDASSGTVTVRFDTPLFYRIGDVISLISALLLIALMLWQRKKAAPSAASPVPSEESTQGGRLNGHQL